MNSLADQVRSLRGEYRLTPKQKYIVKKKICFVLNFIF